MELVKCLSESPCMKVSLFPSFFFLLLPSSLKKIRTFSHHLVIVGGEAIIQGVRGGEEPVHPRRMCGFEGDLLQLQEGAGMPLILLLYPF